MKLKIGNSDQTIDRLGFVTPKIRTRLQKVGICSLEDAILHIPARYEDETRLTLIKDLEVGKLSQVEGTILDSKVVYRPRRQLSVKIDDGTGLLILRFFNFYPNQKNALANGNIVRAIGDVRAGLSGKEITHPRFKIIHGSVPLPENLTPIYSTTAGLTQVSLRRVVSRAFSELIIEDTLPAVILKRLSLQPFPEAVKSLHFPPPDIDPIALEDKTHAAWRRIKFDELFAQQLLMKKHYKSRSSLKAPPIVETGPKDQLLKKISFELTASQKKSLEEIRRDLSKPYPMNRLLQGDVGSGKTIVALAALLEVVRAGYQVAVMAPTEILAEQHFRKFSFWLKSFGIEVYWLAGKLKQRDRNRSLGLIKNGEAKVIVGTHSLFQSSVIFKNLAFAIVDEQHRFGVAQRLALRSKGRETLKGLLPHQLMMSATPIPRTLAMSYYADLDISTINELPPGRIPVVTKLVSSRRRKELIAWVEKVCNKGRQVYWVCPVINETENSIKDGRTELKSAVATYNELAEHLPRLPIGIVHGKLNADEKAVVMDNFVANEIKLLVATTVVEVGVDVPNASMMVIEHAERMGLSQLHQLRGRVGRGKYGSTCVLLYQQPLSDLARARLKIIFESNDGFEIAAHDLKLRGPGELIGAKQSGVPLLRFADIERDSDLLRLASELADEMLNCSPKIANAHISRWLGYKSDYLKV